MRTFLVSIILLAGTSLLKAEDPKNILLIISDDLNTRIGPYMDVDKHTPNLDRLAREGIRFTRAYCQYPVCGPSRASLMSGLYPETNGILSNAGKLGSYKVATPALADHPSLAGFFRQQGYYTARVSKIFHMGVPGGIERGESGPDEPDSWDYVYNVMGPETMSSGKMELLSPKNLHYGSNFSRMILPDHLDYTQTDYLAASQAIAILENRVNDPPEHGTYRHKLKKDAPFFLAVGFVRPHVPFVAPGRCFEPYPENRMQIPAVVVGENVPEPALRRQNDKIWGMNELQKRRTISAYMASVRFMDQQVGRLLDALDRLGVRDETIVIFISDHGYNLGEHDCWSKVSLWEGSVRVPMIISDPEFGENHGSTCRAVTELIDLYPTLTELCNMSDRQPGILQGKSLIGYMQGNNLKNSEKQAYTVSYGGKDATLRTDRWRYTRWGEEAMPGSEELYDHRNDPEEHINLADDPAKKEILTEMRGKFDIARKRARTGLKYYQ
jgi:arylsulfatase A-like enzyme